MTAAAAVVADIRHVIELLGSIDDSAAARLGFALKDWVLRGTEIEVSLGLGPRWRKDLQTSARDAALGGLLALHSDLDDSRLADLIVEGLERLRSFPSDAQRPDHSGGYLVDLLRTGYVCGWRNWRRLAAQVRGQRAQRLATAAMNVWLLRSKPEGLNGTAENSNSRRRAAR
jgi:hypothetical protein